MPAHRRAPQRQTEPQPGELGRRRFLGYLLAAPTLAVAVPLGESALGEAPIAGASPPEPGEVYDLSDLLLDSTRPTANLITVVVNEDGTVSFALPRQDSGQGTMTSTAMLIAEEMDLPLEKVTVTLADARPELVFNQFTAGTNTTITTYTPIRVAAAIAKGRLLEAAAIQLGDEVTNLETRAGRVIAKSTGASIPFGELARSAASIETVRTAADLKPESEFTIIGTEQNRIDALDAVTGRKQFTTDLAIPDAKPTMVCRPPTTKGTVESVANMDQVRTMPGITDVVTIPTGVAVRGETFGQCIDAIRALEVTWTPGSVDGESDETILEQLKAAEVPLAVPDLGPLTEMVEGAFTFYWKNNAAMEPNTAIADVREDRAQIWTASQTPILLQQTIATEFGMALEAVTVHVVPGGGAFGRRMFTDAPLEAARISRAIGKPVRLMWHRTDECRAGRTHPMCTARVRATYNKSTGKVLTYEQRHTSVSTDYTQGFGEILTSRAAKLPQQNELQYSQSVFYLTCTVPYDFGGVTLALNEIFEYDTFNTGSVRNLVNPDFRPAQELIVDQLAAGMGKDPYRFRREFLEEERTRKVLDKVAEVGDWGRSMPAGTAQGISLHEEYKGVNAVLAEVDARPETVNRRVQGGVTGPRVTKVVMAVDVGLPINPCGLRAQMEGGIMGAIGQVFTESTHLRDGNFLEGSWDDYYFTREWNVPPEVEVIVMPPNGNRPGGAGEFGVAAAKAAMACAYARATGTMPTSFPINHNDPVPFRVKSYQPPIPPSPVNGLTAYPAPNNY
jgi:isoquinoline 1-oxidoreductase beta subunit